MHLVHVCLCPYHLIAEIYFKLVSFEIYAFSIKGSTPCLCWSHRGDRLRITGTCFIQKIYAPSSSLLQGKQLPFTPSPLRLNIFRLFVILSLT